MDLCTSSLGCCTGWLLKPPPVQLAPGQTLLIQWTWSVKACTVMVQHIFIIITSSIPSEFSGFCGSCYHLNNGCLLGLCTMLWLTVPVSWWINEVYCWPASTSKAKVFSYFPIPEALKGLFLEFSGPNGSEQGLCPLLLLYCCDWP